MRPVLFIIILWLNISFLLLHEYQYAHPSTPDSHHQGLFCMTQLIRVKLNCQWSMINPVQSVSWHQMISRNSLLVSYCKITRPFHLLLLTYHFSHILEGSTIGGVLLGSPGENITKLGTILPLSYTKAFFFNTVQCTLKNETCDMIWGD